MKFNEFLICLLNEHWNPTALLLQDTTYYIATFK